MTAQIANKYWIGVDLGGTCLRVVLSDAKGRLIERFNENVDVRTSNSISKQIIRIINSICAKHKINTRKLGGIGIASAGPLIMKEGVLTHPPNLRFERIPLTEPIEAELGVAACLINDCAGAALGERKFGAAQKHDNFVYITISTGIGGGVIENGCLLLGKDGNGHEIGHFVIDCAGRLTCGCGRRGHWEAYCSGRNMPNYVRMRVQELPHRKVNESLLSERVGRNFEKLVASDLFEAAKLNDGLALKLVDEIGVLNAMGFANVMNAYDPSLITVGGSVILKNESLVLPPIIKHADEYSINRVPKIKVTPLGEDVVLYGAVATAMKYLS